MEDRGGARRNFDSTIREINQRIGYRLQELHVFLYRPVQAFEICREFNAIWIGIPWELHQATVDNQVPFFQ